MFTKVEQKSSIVLKSNKSTKSALDKDKIDTLFGKSKKYNIIGLTMLYPFTECIRRRYGDLFEYKSLIQTLNQKCRDASWTDDIIFD